MDNVKQREKRPHRAITNAWCSPYMRYQYAIRGQKRVVPSCEDEHEETVPKSQPCTTKDYFMFRDARLQCIQEPMLDRRRADENEDPNAEVMEKYFWNFVPLSSLPQVMPVSKTWYSALSKFLLNTLKDSISNSQGRWINGIREGIGYDFWVRNVTLELAFLPDGSWKTIPLPDAEPCWERKFEKDFEEHTVVQTAELLDKKQLTQHQLYFNIFEHGEDPTDVLLNGRGYHFPTRVLTEKERDLLDRRKRSVEVNLDEIGMILTFATLVSVGVVRVRSEDNSTTHDGAFERLVLCDRFYFDLLDNTVLKWECIWETVSHTLDGVDC